MKFLNLGTTFKAPILCVYEQEKEN